MSLRVLFVESSVGGVGGSLHSLWTLVSHLNPDKVQAAILAFQEIPFWDRFRERDIPVDVWADAGRQRGRRSLSTSPTGGKVDFTPTGGDVGVFTVPGSGARMAQPAWRRGLFGLGHLLLEDLPLAYRLARLARSRRIHILHGNDRLGSNRFVALAGWLSGCPVVQHERLVAPYGWTDIWVSGWLAETLCVSSQVATAVRAMGHRGRSIRVLHNAVKVPPMASVRTTGDRPRVGIVGRLTGWKGQDLFLDAMSRLTGHPSRPVFSIVGAAPPGSESYAASLEETAERPPLAGLVEFSGHVADPMPAIAALSVLVVASRTPEPFGRTVVEAMGQGVPVVVPAAGGPAEIVEDGKTGLHYPPNDAAGLARAVARLLQEPGLAKAMGCHGRKVVEERYRPSLQARTLESIYHRLIPAGA